MIAFLVAIPVGAVIGLALLKWAEKRVEDFDL